MNQDQPVVMITGAAHRVGAEMAQLLHAAGFRVIIHYRRSANAAEALAHKLNEQRTGSSVCLQADLLDMDSLSELAQKAQECWGRLDALINNASSFYPTPLGESDQAQWDDLMGSNLRAPYFLSQACWPFLQQAQGAIVNIVDIHADRPLKGHPIYSMAKAGLAMMTKSLAREMAPEVRVNGVAPGAILWPEQGLENFQKQEILDRVALKRKGSPHDIARAVRYLLVDADYVTGQIIAVDGGRSLFN